MEPLLRLMTKIVNALHDLLLNITEKLGMVVSDKVLHFWIIGAIGIVSFLVVHIVFRKLAAWSITSISFIYTFTVVLVVVFGIEIEQGITGRGHMDLQDALIGLYGFLALFAIYMLIVLFFKGIKYWTRYNKKKNSDTARRYYG